MHRLKLMAAVTALSLSLSLSPVAFAQESAPVSAAFSKTPRYGVWSKNIFADSIGVSGPARIIYLSGMGAEDVTSGAILHPGDFLAQCRYAYGKIKSALEAQGATMADIVKVTTYVTDMRHRAEYAKCRQEAVGTVPPSTHTFINVAQLAWPGMLLEVDATAVVAAR